MTARNSSTPSFLLQAEKRRVNSFAIETSSGFIQARGFTFIMATQRNHEGSSANNSQGRILVDGNDGDA
ncbi:hypothetical protein RRF57_005247 [Xylaria bambusicola]|uniref:Uncharacterized protein n=1 Tax=Xylaria bambusicola TaxID=326684 RepID=A0AAN7UJI4_9PEZI